MKCVNYNGEYSKTISTAPSKCHLFARGYTPMTCPLRVACLSEILEVDPVAAFNP